MEEATEQRVRRLTPEKNGCWLIPVRNQAMHLSSLTEQIGTFSPKHEKR